MRLKEDHPQAGGHRQQGAKQSKQAKYTAPQLRPETPSAEQVAAHLDRSRRIGPGRWIACCPAHDDRSPSLQITDGRDRVLLKCWTGCDYSEIRDALQAIGALPRWRHTMRPSRPRLSQGDLDYLRSYCLLFQSAESPTDAERREFDRASRLLREASYSIPRPLPRFTPEELATMHHWCLDYRELVRSGGKPSAEEDRRFRRYSRATYLEGVACE